jgi:hypothetical protein
MNDRFGELHEDLFWAEFLAFTWMHLNFISLVLSGYDMLSADQERQGQATHLCIGNGRLALSSDLWPRNSPAAQVCFMYHGVRFAYEC